MHESVSFYVDLPISTTTAVNNVVSAIVDVLEKRLQCRWYKRNVWNVEVSLIVRHGRDRIVYGPLGNIVPRDSCIFVFDPDIGMCSVAPLFTCNGYCDEVTAAVIFSQLFSKASRLFPYCEMFAFKIEPSDGLEKALTGIVEIAATVGVPEGREALMEAARAAKDAGASIVRVEGNTLLAYVDGGAIMLPRAAIEAAKKYHAIRTVASMVASRASRATTLIAAGRVALLFNGIYLAKAYIEGSEERGYRVVKTVEEEIGTSDIEVIDLTRMPADDVMCIEGGVVYPCPKIFIELTDMIKLRVYSNTPLAVILNMSVSEVIPLKPADAKSLKDLEDYVNQIY